MTAWLISIGPWYTALVAVVTLPTIIALLWALVLILRTTGALSKLGSFIYRKAEQLAEYLESFDDEPFDPEWMDRRLWEETRTR